MAQLTPGRTTAGVTGGVNVALSSAIRTVHSAEVIFSAAPIMKFMEVASKRQELGAQPGTTIQFLKYAALSGSAALTEATDMSSSNLSGSTVSITVTEYGKSIEVTEMLLRSSFDNIMASAVRLLGRSYAETADGVIRDALYGCGNVVYAGSKSRTTLTSSDKLDLGLVMDAASELQINKAPKMTFEGLGECYVCFVHPHQARDIMDDPRWINLANYADPARMVNGVIGKVDDVVFVSTTQMHRVLVTTGDLYVDGVDTTTDVTANANTDVYRALLVGENAVGFAESLAVELRDGGVLDHGRRHKIAWYSIFGAGRIEDNHAYVLESA